MSLTFEQIMSAWSKCINEKDPSAIDSLLSSDFVWQSAAPDHKTPSDDKAKTHFSNTIFLVWIKSPA